MKIIKILLYGLCLLIIAVVGTVALTSRLDSPGGFKTFTVVTGSMSPTIPEGSIIFSKIPKNEKEISKNTIITFEQPGYKNKFVTHRVYELRREFGYVKFKTKGDNNSIPDNWIISFEKIKGLYLWHVPFLGEVLASIKKPVGFIIFIGVPIVFLIAQELKVIVEVLISMKLENKNS